MFKFTIGKWNLGNINCGKYVFSAGSVQVMPISQYSLLLSKDETFYKSFSF